MEREFSYIIKEDNKIRLVDILLDKSSGKQTVVTCQTGMNIFSTVDVIQC